VLLAPGGERGREAAIELRRIGADVAALNRAGIAGGILV